MAFIINEADQTLDNEEEYADIIQLNDVDALCRMLTSQQS